MQNSAYHHGNLQDWSLEVLRLEPIKLCNCGGRICMRRPVHCKAKGRLARGIAAAVPRPAPWLSSRRPLLLHRLQRYGSSMSFYASMCISSCNADEDTHLVYQAPHAAALHKHVCQLNRQNGIWGHHRGFCQCNLWFVPLGFSRVGIVVWNLRNQMSSTDPCKASLAPRLTLSRRKPQSSLP